MSIFIDENSKVIVQGLTGSEGTKHATKMLKSGTNIVGGVNARKAGQTVTIEGKDLTVFGTVEEAIKETGADAQVATMFRYPGGQIATTYSASTTRGPNVAVVLGTSGRIEIDSVWYTATGLRVYDGNGTLIEEVRGEFGEAEDVRGPAQVAALENRLDRGHRAAGAGLDAG